MKQTDSKNHAHAHPLDALAERISMSIQFAGKTLVIEELTVGQSIALSKHTDALAKMDWGNVPKLLATQSEALIPVLALVLNVDEERVFAASNTELMLALQAVVALNKSFFLLAAESVVAATTLYHALKARLETDLPSPAATPSRAPSSNSETGQAQSAAWSHLVTTSNASTATPMPASAPTSPPLSATSASA